MKLNVIIVTILSIFPFLSNGQISNVLLIIADDFGAGASNGYFLGPTNPSTPHLDSLRNSGL